LGTSCVKLDWEYYYKKDWVGLGACFNKGDILWKPFWEGHKNSDIGVSEKAFELMKVFIVILGSHEEHGRNLFFGDHLWAPTLGTTLGTLGSHYALGATSNLRALCR
jgi:hypothetical protein